MEKAFGQSGMAGQLYDTCATVAQLGMSPLQIGIVDCRAQS